MNSSYATGTSETPSRASSTGPEQERRQKNGVARKPVLGSERIHGFQAPKGQRRAFEVVVQERRQLGENLAQHAHVPGKEHRAVGSAPAEEAQNLLQHPRRSCATKIPSVTNHGVVDLGVETHVEARAELDRAKDAHRVFAEAHVRIADRAEQVLLEVGHATDEVDHLAALEVVEQAIDGEIAPNRILVRFAEDVVVRDQQIRVLALGDRPSRRDQADGLGTRAERNLFCDLGFDDLEVLRRVSSVGRNFDDLSARE